MKQDTIANANLNYWALFESLSELYAVYSLDLILVEGSDAYFKAVGTNREAAVGHRLFEIFSDDLQDLNNSWTHNLRASIESVLKHRKPHKMAMQKYSIRYPETEGGGDKVCHWITINAPIFEDGEMKYIIHRIEDVTSSVLEQQNAQTQINAQLRADFLNEAQLKQNAVQQELTLRLEVEAREHKLERILSTIREAFYTLDQHWCLTYVNDCFCEIVGMGRSEVLGHNLWELFPDSVDTDIYRQFHRAMAEQISSQADYYYATWNRWYNHRVYPSHNELTVFGIDITSQKQSEAALQQLSTELQQQVQKFDAIASSVPDFIYTFDLAGRFTYVNKPLLELLGKSFDDAVGKDFFELDYPTNLATQLQQEIQRVITTGESIKNEAVYGHTSDERVYEYIFVPLFNADGVVESVAGITRDIHIRKQVEAYLTESENRLQMALLGAQQGIWDWDLKNQVLTWDERCKEMFGLSSNFEANYAWFLEVLHPEDRKRIDDAVAVALHDHTEFNEEYRAIHADSTLRWILARGRGFYNAAGEAYRMSGTVMDITDRRQAEAILRESEERFRHMADSAPMLVWMSGTDKLCYYFNQPWLDFTGRTTEQELGNGWTEGVHPEDFQTCLETYTNAFNARLPFEMDYRLRRFDGEYRWILDAGQPRFTVQGEFLGYIGSCIDVTDRVQAVNALRESERKFSAIFDQTFEFIGLLSLDGVLQEVNQSALDSIAAQKTDIVGKYFWDTPWWTHSQELQEQLRENINLAASGQFVRYEVTFPSGSGAPMVTTFSLKPVFDEGGQVVMLIGEGYDITDRKQAEAALRKSEERYRTLFESIDEGFCIVEVLFDENQNPIDYLFLEVNPAFEEQTGLYRPVGKTIRQLVPDIEYHWIAVYGYIVLTGEAKRFENNSQALNRYFEAYACRIGEPEERKVAIIFKDITDRKRSEKALQDSEEQSRNILESITDAFFALSSDWRFTYLNPQAEHLLNRTPDDLIDKIIWEEYEITGSEFGNAYLQVANERISTSFVAFYPGHDRWYEVHAYPAIDGITVYFRDVTDLKRIEVEREQLLEREKIARETAETANRIKDEFLATLSHELRAPLNPILGWAQLLQVRTFDQPKLNEALAIIERSARLQAQLIDDLLDIAKILRGKLTMESTCVDLVFVIASALDTVKSAASAKSIHIHQELPQSCQVAGDAARLQQVVWNLLSNAVKFTPNHGQVHIQLQQASNQAQIIVSDTGKGIDPSFLPHIFETFRQEDATTTRKYGGLGLGLAIVRTLVEAHGGTISAESKGVEKGAKFTVCLPLIASNRKAESTVVLERQEPQLIGVRVLVVDDDLANRELLIVALSQYGVEVLCVASAADALDCLDSFAPDVLVSDIGMPDMDGYIFLQTLRSLPPEKGGQIPAIALTSYARQQDIQRAFESGFHRHVTKPINLNQFVQVVESLVLAHTPPPR